MNYGEIIELGRHRLMCGDATKLEDVQALIGSEKARILFTSPPYYDLRDYEGCNNDTKYLAGFIESCKDYCEIMCVNLGLVRRNHEYITYWDEYISRAHSCGLKLLSWNVWDKLNPGVIGHQQAMFPLRHEFIFVFGERPIKLNRTIPKHGKIDQRPFSSVREKNGATHMFTRNTLLNEKNKPLETVYACHPVKSNIDRQWGVAMMPLKLAQEYILACTNEGDNVIDCFGGSGTTLIACELTGRKCLMMEISPEYCDIIKKRYENLTEGTIKFHEGK